MGNEVSLEQFENYLAKKNHTLTHWGMPSLKLFLKLSKPGVYDLICEKDDKILFEHSEDFFYQIHYDPSQRLIGLYVKSKNRAWFLEEIDLIEETGILLYTFKMVKEKLELMQEIYERETK